MKVSILRDGLQGLVNAAMSASARRGTLPVLQMLKIEAEDGQGVTVTGTNLELTLAARSYQAQIQEGGVALVPAASFSEFLNALPSQMVKIVSTDAGLSVECQGNRARFKTVPAEEFPAPRVWPDAPPLVANAEELREAVKRCAPAAASNDARPALTGLHLVARGRELHVEAADGYRMALSAATLAAPGEFEALVSAKLLDAASRWWGQTVVNLRMDAGRALFLEALDGGLRAELSMIDGNYPDVTPFRNIPAGHGSCEADVSDLVAALKAARVLQDSNLQSVRLAWSGEGVVLTTQDSERGDATCGCPAVAHGTPPATEVLVVSQYLAHALSGLTGRVLLSWGDKARQIVVQSTDGAPVTLHAIMPLIEGSGTGPVKKM